ncbi:hypothetical protein ACFVT9_07445 [Kitasatospora cineracea]|uniref:hypothetical protein n=1 Tax=Kitasatospora cineracea TaxID=88074 RepID=UPI0036DB8795
MPGRTFSTGSGFTGRSPAARDLSTVTTPLRQDVTTTASTPELDAAGSPTGRTLAGAVTVALSDGERAAVQRNNLIARGGTKADPLNGRADAYSFAALRCAQDAVNGDGVNDFALNASSTASGSMDFIRAATGPGDAPWTFQEHIDPDSGRAPPSAPRCTATAAGGGPDAAR